MVGWKNQEINWAANKPEQWSNEIFQWLDLMVLVQVLMLASGYEYRHFSLLMSEVPNPSHKFTTHSDNCDWEMSLKVSKGTPSSLKNKKTLSTTTGISEPFWQRNRTACRRLPVHISIPTLIRYCCKLLCIVMPLWCGLGCSVPEQSW